MAGITLSDYAEQVAYLIKDDFIALEWYSTKDAAKLFKVKTSSTVLSWIKNGYFKDTEVDARETMRHTGKKRQNPVYRYYIHQNGIDRVLRLAPFILSNTRRTWPRLVHQWELSNANGGNPT